MTKAAGENMVIGSDHAGYELKERIKAFLKTKQIIAEDIGCFDASPVDYSDYALKVAAAVSSGLYGRGVLICGTGIGMSIAANRFPQTRAALCHNVFTAEASRRHNNANILVLGARVLEEEEALHILDVWLETPFEGGRHQKRLDKIELFRPA
jgi:ribose 5-phosphate isomerase B